MSIPLSAVEQTEFYLSQPAITQSLEMAELDEARSRGLDSVLTLQGAIRDLEVKLGIDENDRWTPGSPQWIEVEANMNHSEYQLVIDRLEGLVVGRLFELAKLHQSGIGMIYRLLSLLSWTFYIQVLSCGHISQKPSKQDPTLSGKPLLSTTLLHQKFSVPNLTLRLSCNT